MKTKATIAPDISARQLFGRMVARSDGNHHLPLVSALRLCVDLRREGHDPAAEVEVQQLQAKGWIEPAGDGGWFLGEGNPLGTSL